MLMMIHRDEMIIENIDKYNNRLNQKDYKVTEIISVISRMLNNTDHHNKNDIKVLIRSYALLDAIGTFPRSTYKIVNLQNKLHMVISQYYKELSKTEIIQNLPDNKKRFLNDFRNPTVEIDSKECYTNQYAILRDIDQELSEIRDFSNMVNLETVRKSLFNKYSYFTEDYRQIYDTLIDYINNKIDSLK